MIPAGLYAYCLIGAAFVLMGSVHRITRLAFDMWAEKKSAMAQLRVVLLLIFLWPVAVLFILAIDEDDDEQ